MAQLQKQLMDVRLLGLDEKANPRVPVQPGIIIDGRNWAMSKDGRVSKRPGTTAQAMSDGLGHTLVGRELSQLGGALVLGTRSKIHSRTATGTTWDPRGYRAYESMRIQSVCATNAVCNGIDALLQYDSATIGDTTYIVMSGGNAVGSESETKSIFFDNVTGQVTSTGYWPGHFGVIVSDTGESSNQRAVFSLEKGTGNLWIDVPADGSVKLATDVAQPYDRVTYGLQPYGVQAAPYAVQRVAVNTWIVAYQDTGISFVCRKISRTALGAYTVGDAQVVESSIPSVALVPAIAYHSGDSTAKVAGLYYGTIYYGTVTISTGAVSGTGSLAPSAWNATETKPLFRGFTGIVVSSVAYFFADVISWDANAVETRDVWHWSPGRANATIFARNCGLFCHAYQPDNGDDGEISIGLVNVSTWQPSAFLMRTWVAGGYWDRQAIGAHLAAGDYAGRSCSQLLPKLSTAVLLGILNEPISLGGPGTVLLKLATIGFADTYTACSPPAEIGGTLVLPGACLKAYDGKSVTEAAFLLGPESVAAEETTIGKTYTADATGTLVPYPDVVTAETASPVPAESYIAANFVGTSASINLLTAAGTPGLATWPAGKVTISVWVRIDTPAVGATYSLYRGASGPGGYVIDSSPDATAWQSADVASTPIDDTWTQVTWTVDVSEITVTEASRVRIKIKAIAVGGSEMEQFHVAVGGARSPRIDLPFPSLAIGTRQYCACMAWTDAQGRTQRSQVSPITTYTGASGYTAAITVPNLEITERSSNRNYDSGLHPAVIEVYRTEASSTTFYRLGSMTNSPTGAPLVMYDRLSDADLVSREQLYTTGGVVSAWPPIGANLVQQHQGRMFVATADNQVYFSGYVAQGEGLHFAAEFWVETEHLPGRLTALLSLDDKLALCTADAIAQLGGFGPELTGTPVYDSPMVIGSQFGPINQRACARAPDGWGCITSHGVYMLDRGLQLKWIGPAVTDEAPGDFAWFAACYTDTGEQLRFSTGNQTLVYDLTLPGPPGRMSQWFRWSYPFPVTAYAIAGGYLYQLQLNGSVYLADEGLTDAGTSFQEWLQLAVVSPAGPNGWSRIYRAELTCDVAEGSTIKVSFTNGNYGMSEDATTLLAPTGGLKDVLAEPRYGQCSKMTIWIGENAATATAGITLDAIGLLVGVKGGLGRLGAANRAARST